MCVHSRLCSSGLLLNVTVLLITVLADLLLLSSFNHNKHGPPTTHHPQPYPMQLPFWLLLLHISTMQPKSIWLLICWNCRHKKEKRKCICLGTHDGTEIVLWKSTSGIFADHTVIIHLFFPPLIIVFVLGYLQPKLNSLFSVIQNFLPSMPVIVVSEHLDSHCSSGNYRWATGLQQLEHQPIPQYWH